MCLGLALAWRGVKGGLVLRRVYGGDSSLVNKVVTKAIAFEGATVFLFAVTGSFRRGVCRFPQKF